MKQKHISLFMMSAKQRVGWASVLSIVLWALVYWALR